MAKKKKAISIPQLKLQLKILKAKADEENLRRNLKKKIQRLRFRKITRLGKTFTKAAKISVKAGRAVKTIPKKLKEEDKKLSEDVSIQDILTL